MRGAEAMPALLRISQVTAIFVSAFGHAPGSRLALSDRAEICHESGGRASAAVGEQHRGKIHDCIDESQSAAPVNLKIRNKPFDYFEPADGYVHFIGAFKGWPLMLSFANADSRTKKAHSRDSVSWRHIWLP
jgi:hypothetical protein